MKNKPLVKQHSAFGSEMKRLLTIFSVAMNMFFVLFITAIVLAVNNDQFILGTDDVAAYKAKRAALEAEFKNAQATYSGYKLLSPRKAVGNVEYPTVFEYTDPSNGQRVLVFENSRHLTAVPADAPNFLSLPKPEVGPDVAPVE